MKNKTILSLMAIFLVLGSAAFAYAQEVNYDGFDLQFADDDFKVNQTNNTSVVLRNGGEQIIITSEITGNDSVNSFLSAQGFNFTQSTHVETKVSSTQSGSFEYELNEYAKDKGAASAFFLNKNDKNYTVIVMDNDVDADDDFDTSDAMDVAKDIVKSIMLA
ncbi:MAG: hypothetical protein IJQ68_00625 [Methanobrevibacter sp.]|uniref:hypothetical protein n=1 Tax=Methanobrevibacter sp. TaxID=66852 RepID=UPI0025DF6C00|nr:hypothetical protein [Methanobrevibacter sp.]MBR0270491.1 hypothetical protein [Methanobrevibacter sp.]